MLGLIRKLWPWAARSSAQTALGERAHSSGDPFRVSPYYEVAEAHIDELWDTLIWPRIDGLDFTRVLDLATGHGRNAAKLQQVAGELVLVDINEECLAACRKRFRGDPRFSFARTNGYDLEAVDDEDLTLVYSFDAMVHFDPDVVAAYLPEIRRVLRPGGHAFLHHSNFAERPDGDFRDSPHWRNHMSVELFAEMARSAGLEVVRSEVIDWGREDDLVEDLDGLTLLRRPEAKLDDGPTSR
jgi:SAM-dependent methyltransferase